LVEFKQFTWNEKKPVVRNFATTSSLLCTAWAQTPQRLVNEIRYQAARLIEAGATFQLTDANIHVHIGVPELTKDYPYWVHIAGDIRTATFRVGDAIVHDRGHLTALEHPAVKAVAAEYPGRPGLPS
jgi:hypothetical protein